MLPPFYGVRWLDTAFPKFPSPPHALGRRPASHLAAESFWNLARSHSELSSCTHPPAFSTSHPPEASETPAPIRASNPQPQTSPRMTSQFPRIKTRRASALAIALAIAFLLCFASSTRAQEDDASQSQRPPPPTSTALGKPTKGSPV